MLLAFLLLLFAAAIIYLSCEFFVNGVEWVGLRLGVAKTAVGTILAAFGTALPESVVTLVAVAFGSDSSHKDLGVGAALGGPLVLATVAYAVVGMVFVANGMRGQLLSAGNAKRLSRDQFWFMLIFVVKIGLGLVVFSWKPWLGVLFLLAYALYVWQEMRAEDEVGAEAAEEEALEPLKLQPKAAEPALAMALLQTGLALVVIFFGSQLFVHQLDVLGPQLGIPAQLVALLFSPVATELPELMNAVIWVRQGKHSLALGNISGSMMIQATIPCALGIFYTPWLLGHQLQWAALVTLLAILGIFVLLRRHALTGARLAYFGLLYAVFAGGLLLI